MAAPPSDRKFFGIVTGIAVIVVWAFGTTYIESMTLAYHQDAFQNPLLAWITLGPVPLLLAAGMYYFTRSDLSDARRRQDFAGLKGMAAAFFLWLFALLFFPVQPMNDENYLYLTMAGYFLMLILGMAFQGKFRRAETGCIVKNEK